MAATSWVIPGLSLSIDCANRLTSASGKQTQRERGQCERGHSEPSPVLSVAGKCG